MIPIGHSASSARLESVPLDVFTFRPDGPVAGFLFLFHGNSRNAADYPRYAEDAALRHGLVLIAPLFDEARFPSASYHRGNIVDGSGRVRPAHRWTTRLVPLLVEWARQQEAAHLPYWLWGFSAGGQFLSRVAAFEQPQARRIVICSPSSYVLPLLGTHPRGEKAPYGMGGVFAAEEESDKLRGYLALPLCFHIGRADTDPEDELLSTNRAASRQGSDRLDRGRRTLALGASVASENGWPFGWRLVVDPQTGHSSREMLRSERLAEALGYLPVPSPRDPGRKGRGPTQRAARANRRQARAG